MKNILYIFIFFISSLCYSQVISDSITIKENIAWLQKLENISLKKDKIDFILQKIKSDSIYKDATIKIDTYSSKDGHIHELIKNEVSCKIIFALIQKKKFYILDLNKFPAYSAFLKYLNSESIDKITVLKGLAATSLFGSQGNCGVVYLEADKKLKLAME